MKAAEKAFNYTSISTLSLAIGMRETIESFTMRELN
jgi:hypothetical protein